MFYSNPTGCTILFFLAKFLALHVSDVICIHHQKHNCSVQPYVFLWFWCIYSMEQVLALEHFAKILLPSFIGALLRHSTRRKVKHTKKKF
jgi:hypothetical protein